MSDALRLRSLNWPARVGLVFTVLVLLGGLGASAAHLVGHHELRDERAGISLDDLRGAYHGIRTRAPLVVALERPHPEDMPEADRSALLEWLAGDRITEDYDSLELGDRAPAELLDRHCVACHARNAERGDGIGRDVPLEYWDDVRAVALARDVTPTELAIVVASTHTHALGMGSLTVLAALLALLTRWSRRLVGVLIAGAGIGLFCDLASWLPAREFEVLVPVLAVSGGVWLVSSALLLLLTLADLLLPGDPSP